MSATEAIEQLKNELNAGYKDDLWQYRVENDELGITNKRYQQYYNNIKVEGGEYIVHSKNGKVTAMNGLWIEDIELSTMPGVSEATALAAALKHFGAKTYQWQVVAEEQILKEIKNDAKATYFPKGELVVVSRNLDYKKRDLHFCYKFDIFANQPESRKWLYVDASTGEVVAEVNKICGIAVPATAVTRYSGTQTITVDSLAPGSYRLRDYSRCFGIETYDMNTGTSYAAAVDFTNTTSLWNTTTSYDNAAYDAHWGGAVAYDYYLSKHSRNSLDNAGIKLLLYVHYDAAWNGAAWDGTRMKFGDGTNVAGGHRPEVALDICGHELTHGVIDYTCNLITANESGALNESYADIMGTNMEFWKKPTTANWLLGSEVFVTAGAYRSLSNPNAYNQPDTYKGTYWDSSGADLGGVHKNNGVNNYWYYLLCMGGSGTNDIGNAFSVTGIGMVKAEQIVYRMMSYYLTAYSEYADARIYAIQAATDLYGACSAEVIAVTKAWYAVGVGSNYTGAVSVNFTQSGTLACSAPFDVSFSNISINASAATWYFGDGSTSSSWSAAHTYSAPGVYSVKLVVNGACGSDSLTRSNLISVTTPTAPTGSGGARCGSGTVNLAASGAGILKWFTSASGGASINTGSTFTTPSIGGTTTYYVEDNIPGTAGYVGPVDQTFGANGPFGNVYPVYLVFDVYKACILRSVDVVATVAGTRNIDIINGSGTVLHTFTFTISSGAHTLNLDFPLQPGTGYHIGGDSLSLTFTANNTSYPYTMAGVAAITKSTLDIGTVSRYPFFYHWLIEPDTCKSVRSAVTAVVNPLPASITGTASVYEGGTTTLSSTTSGGTWSSSSSSVAIVGAGTGIVTGVASGTATITYTLPTGCLTTIVVTVNSLPGCALTGALSSCIGGLSTLSSSVSGGAWSSSNTSVATVSSVGVVTAVTVGSAIISYSAPGICSGGLATAVFTVNPSPAAITGSGTICVGGSTTLTSTTSGGTWTSSNTSVATVTGTGSVTGVASGTSYITYTLATGCFATGGVSVNPLPGTISGTLSVFEGATATLSSSTTGGTWTSSNTSVATVGATSGIVTGIASGTAAITYSVSTGCIRTAIVTVNSLAGCDLSGTLSLCVGNTSALTSSVSGGSWSSSNITVATVSASGVVSGVSAGTAAISYVGSGICGVGYVVAIFTVYPLPAMISGTTALCNGATSALSCSPGGGTWSSSDALVAIVSTSGVVTGTGSGTATISYTSSTGCAIATVVTVSALPGTITGSLSVCIGTSNSLSSTPSGGTWSSSSTYIATVDYYTGMMTGVHAGTARITYTVAGGCHTIAIATVNNSPGALSGLSSVCDGSTITLSSATWYGVWSSSDGTVASVVTTGGAYDNTSLVSGLGAGTATISYTIGSCAATKVVTVTAGIGAITGSPAVCVGTSSALSSAASGGTWSSSATAKATVNSAGVVTGVSTGTATITYRLSATCFNTITVTVSAAPSAITGTLSVCPGATTALGHATSGGAWSSSITAKATIDISTGIATGVASGTTKITYAVGGCFTTSTLVINAAPASIGGTATLCSGSSTSLSCSPGGGTWSSADGAVATIGATGIVTGVSAGTATISYTNGGGCAATIVVTVTAAPSAIAGTLIACIGGSTTLTSGPAGGTWTSWPTSKATVNATTGVVTGIAAGTARITYTISAGCYISDVVTVSASPGALSGLSSLCSGGTLTLSSATWSGAWSSSDGAVASAATLSITQGLITGLSAGTTTISYTVGSCSATKTVTVNAAGGAIAGDAVVCVGQTNATLTSGLTGGTWSSSASATANVHATTGLITGVAVGTATITYTASPGCYITAVATVNAPVSAITGATSVIVGSTITLANATGGGTWSSSNTYKATIVAGTGDLTGVASGTTTITYSVSAGCYVTRTETVFSSRHADPVTSTGVSGLFSVFPNPSSGSLTVHASVAGVFTLHTIDGRQLAHYQIKDAPEFIKLPNDLTAGVYMCRFNGDDGSTEMMRLVLRK